MLTFYHGSQKTCHVLNSVGWVRKFDYLTWLLNIILANMVGGDHKMCIDFTDVNTTTPKDCLPFLNIDQLVEVTINKSMASWTTEKHSMSGQTTIRHTMGGQIMVKNHRYPDYSRTIYF